MIAYITELNEENFKSFISNDLVLVDIWAEWCGPCKQISPIVDEISFDFHGILKVGKMNVDNNKDLVATLGVRNIPTILIYKNGEIVDKSVGAITKNSLTELINKHKNDESF
jgi:thioredoxin 1